MRQLTFSLLWRSCCYFSSTKYITHNTSSSSSFSWHLGVLFLLWREWGQEREQEWIEQQGDQERKLTYCRGQPRHRQHYFSWHWYFYWPWVLNLVLPWLHINSIFLQDHQHNLDPLWQLPPLSQLKTYHHLSKSPTLVLTLPPPVSVQQQLLLLLGITVTVLDVELVFW